MLDLADVVARFNLASLPGHGQVFAASSGGAALTSGDSIAATGNGAGGYTATVYYQPNAKYSGGDSSPTRHSTGTSAAHPRRHR